ncbi:hypothetical protein ABZP36_003419 [Zizania latifolia]
MATSPVTSSGFDEGFSKPSATDHCASRSWSDLPVDLLHLILQRLELPESVAVANVCTSWCSAVAVAGVPRFTPWLISWSMKRPLGMDDCGRPIGCEFRNLINTHRTYEVNLPSLDWVGASHGWLAGTNDLSNLLLYNPFTSATIHLPPITDLEGVEAVYDSDGSIVRYMCGKRWTSYDVKYLGSLFYEKVVLSGAPSQGGDYVTMIIHCHFAWVSFASAKEGRWRLASTINKGIKDRYADCVYHKGRFYVLTLCGVLEMWDLDNPCEPRKEGFFAEGDGKYKTVFLRFLLSTPWGDLLQIRIRRCRSRQVYPTIRIKLELLEVDIENNKLVSLISATATAALREHAIFVGQNHSLCLPTKDFPELRPNCVYFATPCLGHHDNFPYGRGDRWRGVGIYDLQNQIFEDAFPFCERRYSTWLPPSEVWIIPDL